MILISIINVKKEQYHGREKCSWEHEMLLLKSFDRDMIYISASTEGIWIHDWYDWFPWDFTVSFWLSCNFLTLACVSSTTYFPSYGDDAYCNEASWQLRNLNSLWRLCCYSNLRFGNADIKNCRKISKNRNEIRGGEIGAKRANRKDERMGNINSKDALLLEINGSSIILW